MYWGKGSSSASLFNENWYLQNNPDVAEAVRQGLITAEQHFALYGKYENRSPSPFFDPVLYLQQNPDVAAAVQSGLINAFDHFMSYGQNENRSPSLFFDPDVYLANSPDIAAALEAGLITSAFEHFLLYGQYEPRNISPFLDLKAYLDANPDVAAAVRAGLTTAFDHFINHGFTEGRDLGNGISLAQFANDPEAQLAIRNGDVNALMDRISEVAPFLPTYEPPAGYEIPSNIPIPVDFVPVGDEKLTIPPGVEVPADLPPIFEVPGAEEPEQPGTGGGGGSGGGGGGSGGGNGGGGGGTPGPVDTVTTYYGKVSRVGMDVPSETPDDEANNLWVGGGNSADNFHVTRTDKTKVELALKGYVRGAGDVVDADEDGVYEFGADDKVGFAYSVASLGDHSLQHLLKQGYSFHLKIDIDRGSGTNFVEFELALEDDFGPRQDSGLKWVRAGGDPIVDDEGLVTDGATYATQNIQTPLWYGANVNAYVGDALRSGEYTVVLEMQYEGKTVAAEEIRLDVAQSYHIKTDTDVSLSDVALKDDGTMLNGSGNPGNHFNVTRIDYDQDGAADIEIALGAQQQGGPNIYTPDVNGVITVPGGQNPVFKFSVASLNPSMTLIELLNFYDIKLFVDYDPTEATKFIALQAVANSDDSTGALDWEFPGTSYEDNKGQTPKLVDDQGTDKVSQNIQALSWYIPSDNKLFGPSTPLLPGQYTVKLEVFEKDTVKLVGSNIVTFDVTSGTIDPQ